MATATQTTARELHKPPIWKRVGKWVAGVVGAALLGLGAVTAVMWLVRYVNPPPPPIAEQLSKEFEDAAQNGLRVTFNRQLNLHGTGIDTRVVVFAPGDAAGGAQPQSDELRIYDVVDDRLKLRFTFRPTSSRGAYEPPFALTPLTVVDMDENGSTELISPAFEQFADSRYVHPYLIRWDSEQAEYQTAAILGKNPSNQIESYGGSGTNAPTVIKAPRDSFASGAQKLYLDPTLIRNAGDGSMQQSYGAHAYIFRRTPFSSILVAGFIVRAPINASRWTIQAESWHLSVTSESGEPAGLACGVGPPGSKAVTRLRRGDTLESALARLWRDNRWLSYC